MLIRQSSFQGCSPRDRGLGLESTRDRFFPVLVLVSNGRSWIFLKTDRVSGRLFASYFLQIKIDCLFAKCKSVNLTSINVFEVFDKSNFCVNCVHFVSYCHLRSWSWSWHCRSWLQVCLIFISLPTVAYILAMLAVLVWITVRERLPVAHLLVLTPPICDVISGP